MIVVLDYGINNLRSVEKAIQFLGFECRIQSKLAGASKLVIPGVGAFGKAMERLNSIRGEIQAFAGQGNPVLGICLGQQLLFESSEEFGEHAGLGLIPGRVRFLPSNIGLKVPHMGWNKVSFRACSSLGNGVEPDDRVYFVHSLYTECDDANDVAATTSYGIDFPSAVQRKNVWGTQFHPEKSGEVGLRILRNFLEC
ncbi:MAG: imidazole glycerol phosphate synthase subunit HisH [Chlorobia bacterium]|nr:imidazole glycerol phosphate synthase subunit HisH [Fimbriimonadaceae bacterium]